MFRVRAAATALLAAGCAPRVPEPAPTPAPAPPPPAEAPAATPATPAAPPAAVGTGPWRFAWTTGAQQFQLRTETEVEQRGERERIETTALVTLAVLPAGGTPGRGLSARVDSLRVRASERVAGAGTSSSAIAAPVAVRGTIAARGAVRLESEAAAQGCASPGGAAAATALALVREVVPRLPATLAVGARWRDTTTSAGCAGPVPVTVQAVAAYEVEGLERGLVRVRRRTTSTLRGQGFGGGQSVRVAGTGTGDAALLLDPTVGAVREVAGEGRATITTTIGTATQTFEQRSRTIATTR